MEKISKQDLFVKYFFDSGNKKTFLNAYQSALKAGYSEGTAKDITWRIFKLGNFVKIRERFEEIQRKMISSTEITPEFVLQKLLEVLELFKNPKKMKEYYARTSDIVKVLELLGKYLKMFTEKIDVSGNVEIVILPPKTEENGGNQGDFYQDNRKLPQEK